VITGAYVQVAALLMFRQVLVLRALRFVGHAMLQESVSHVLIIYPYRMESVSTDVLSATLGRVPTA
jgi:hypothetical protein